MAAYGRGDGAHGLERGAVFGQVEQRAWRPEGPGASLMKANLTETALGGPQFEASFGLTALKRLDFIVDGKRGAAYLHPKAPPPSP